LEPAVR